MNVRALPRLLTSGDPAHGVVRYARELALAVAARVGDGGGSEIDGARHLHFSDRVWGESPDAAARRIESLATAGPLTVTLHDLPQASDGPRNLPRRVDCYRRVARVARGVVVSSEHEAALLRDVVRPGAAVAAIVIPLPVDVRPPGAARRPPDDEVAVLGFVYPGKGHLEVIEAVAGLAADGLGVTALGRASDGHETELETLRSHAAGRGVRFTVTGYLDEATMLGRCRRAAVAVAAHQHVSASGSIVAWVAAGRRPLVPDTRYSREMAALRPGTLTLYAAGELAGAVDRARRDPGSTWWDDDATTRPCLEDAAAAHIEWWSHGVEW